ncbi:MAG TPA: OB-fold nucleic acid binding domain-containing protein, partial [Gemmata sp.]|nr:OB-fold nucleic acid binding domain-containing protein [Gemmata sp.]
MSRRFVEQLRDGDNLDDVYLVTDKQLRANRNGNPYLFLELRDRTGGISARLWNAGEHVARGFDPGDFLHATGKVQLFQGSLQVILNSVDRVAAEKVELVDFLPQTEQNVPKLLERLRGYLLRLGNPHLRALAECFLIDETFMRNFTTCPAGVKLHHAYVGGLLEHVVSMMDAADRLLPLYPGVDRDLLLMGVFLHDAGKTRELTYGRAFGYSDEGQLVGHIPIAVEMLTEAAAKVPELTGEPVPRELMLRLH